MLVIGMIVATICFSVYTASEWRQNTANGSLGSSNMSKKIFP